MNSLCLFLCSSVRLLIPPSAVLPSVRNFKISPVLGSQSLPFSLLWTYFYFNIDPSLLTSLKIWQSSKTFLCFYCYYVTAKYNINIQRSGGLEIHIAEQKSRVLMSTILQNKLNFWVTLKPNLKSKPRIFYGQYINIHVWNRKVYCVHRDSF